MINKAILMGRLTRDPEIRHTGSGTPVCNFSIAIDNGYGENRTTDFINCVAWNKTAEFIEKHFTKGKMIIVIGRISTRSWEGSEGKKNYATEVVVSEVSFGAAASNRCASDTSVAQDRNDSGDYEKESRGISTFNEFTPIDTDDDLPY